MKCINKFFAKTSIGISFILTCSVLLGACGKDFELAYENNHQSSNFELNSSFTTEDTYRTFASNLCILNEDYLSNPELNQERFYAAGLFDLKQKKVLYGYNLHTRLHPASLTKIMTALVALQHSNMDEIITCSPNVEITESGAQKIGLKAGDHLTMNQAIHCLLMYSANDAGVAIAEHISGSVENFAVLMNETAISLGATNCNFVNPHGLTDENHYVTAYDLYLIFHKAIQYETFVSIIQMQQYDSIYHDQDGKEKTISFETTNQFLKNVYSAPDGITVIGGKTGSTNAARSCLILLARDVSGNPYIAVMLGNEERGKLYEDMITLLSEATNS